MENLLKRVAEVLDANDVKRRSTGNDFNIFEVANLASDEVRICYVIYELLNPKGSHYQGDAYLRLFVRDVLKLEFTEQDYKSANVVREYVTAGERRRRIDLFIKTVNHSIPIEVKLHADDQPSQCFDYSLEATGDVYYLTLDGRVPSINSAGDLKEIIERGSIIGYEGIRQISFSYDILNWLKKCVALPETNKLVPVREILRQFIDTVKKKTEQLESEEQMEIEKIILSSSKNILAAVEIERTMKLLKAKIMEDLFRELKRLFEEKDRETFGYNEENFIKYFTESRKIWPLLWVKIAELSDVLTAVLCIEVDSNNDCLIFTFGIMKYGTKNVETVALSDAECECPEMYSKYQMAVTAIWGDRHKAWNKIYWDFIYSADGSQKYNFAFDKNDLACVELAQNHTVNAKRIFDMLYGYYNDVISKL